MRPLAVLTCVLLIPAVSWALDKNDPALVGVWLFDEGDGPIVGDLTGNGNDGTINGDFPWVPAPDGKFGGAISATGGGSIDVADSDSVATIQNGLTVAGWFRIGADSDTGIRKQGAFLLEDQSAVEPVPNGFSFRVWTDQGISPGAYGKTELVQGQWHHVAGTYDGSKIELYVDGQPESAQGLLDDGGNDWSGEWSGQVGAGSPLQLKYGPESLIGDMDEFVILNRALGQDEIVQLMGGFENIPEPASLSLFLLGALFMLSLRRRVP